MGEHVVDNTWQRVRSSKSVGWLPVALLLAVCYVGYFKSTLLLRWLGIDPTAILVLLLAVYTVWRQLGEDRVGFRALAPAIGLWALFLPGAVYTATSGGNLYKTIYLFTITLVSVLAAPLILRTTADLRRWIKGSIVAGLALAAVSLVDPDVEYGETFGRLAIDGSSTIGTARVVGAAFVSVVLIACVRRRGSGLGVWLIALCLGAVLFLIGSRGPLLGALVTVGLVLLSARQFRYRRWSTFLAGSVGLGFVIYWAASTNAVGARRLVNFLSAQQVDEGRSSLFRTAWDGVLEAPLGTGWGGFSFLVGDASGAEHPHNIILEVFLEGGWLAGCGLIVFFVCALRRHWLSSHGTVGTVIYALAIYWVAVAQTSSDVNGNRVTFVILSCAFAWSSIRKGVVANADARESDRIGKVGLS